MSTPDADIRVSRLEGGLRVVTETDPQSRSAAVGVWVGVGNRDEPPELAGASHFLEHLLFKGSSTRSARDIAEGIDAVGGDLNAFTSKEYTAFHARVPGWDLDLVSTPCSMSSLTPASVTPRSMPSARSFSKNSIGATTRLTMSCTRHWPRACSPITRLAGRCSAARIPSRQ
ncbi:MAG: hypothetical protein GWP47_13095 [Actinobacteria bacterium]|nr:hypothetical protein [Actinomycetota bacterium]